MNTFRNLHRVMNERKKLTKTKTNIPYRAVAMLALACLAFVQHAQAVIPAPDGGYPGGNTAEGQTALFSLTSGTYNTAVGFSSLRATPSAISTRPLVLARSLPIPEMKTRPSVRQRC
jgi:hypothetical protein